MIKDILIFTMVFGVLILGLMSVNDVYAVTEDVKLTASDGAADDTFGHSVSIDGDTVVVGAKGDDDNGIDSGSAYLYENIDGTWTEAAKLTASDGADVDYFGYSVSIDGDTVVVGAIGDVDNGSLSGSAYIYENIDGTWTETAKLIPSDGARHDYFGHSVSIDGDTVVVGALRDVDNGIESGSAYIYENIDGTWTETAKLIPSDGARHDYFGHSVSIDGDTVVVGARGDVDNGIESGSAYIYENIDGTWTEAAKLTASDGADVDYFGGSVSIDGDTVVVGAVGNDDNGSLSGSAYLYENIGGAWTETKLVPTDNAADDLFGISVSISGDEVVVGASRDDDNGSVSGSAYLYENIDGTWTEAAKLTASDGAADDTFGFSVSIDGDTVVSSARFDDDNGLDSGSAYLFKITDESSDSIPPTITILGDSPFTLLEGTAYVDEGATAVDDVDGDLTDNIVVDSNVDTSIPGEYFVNYTVSDAAGNEATAKRTVIVKSLGEATEELSNSVEELGIPSGTEKQLTSNLDSTIKILVDDNEKNDAAACGKLDSFINKVEAQSGKKIDSDDAESLINSAQELKTALGC